MHLALRGLETKGKALRVCVVGAGHGGLAMAGYLGLSGHPVCLYNRTDENLHAVRWHKGIEVEGAVSGFGPILKATSIMGEAVSDVDLIMVVTPSTAHESLAHQMAPHLRDGQIIILNPGRTGGALAFQRILKEHKVSENILVGETSTFLYASRAVSRSRAHIFRVKNKVSLATLPAHWIPQALKILQGPFPEFVAGSNVLATSMENIGAIFHPALTLLNAGWIESTHGDFDYYIQGITPTIARILEGIDADRLAVAQSLGMQAVSAREWLYLSYDSQGKSLYEAIQNTESYRGISAPPSIAHRYIFEDVPMSLVPLASLGNLLHVKTPMIHLVIQLASVAHGRDYLAEGRTVEKMGLKGMSLKQIRQFVIGDFSKQKVPVREGSRRKASIRKDLKRPKRISR
ncbi:MAG: NAD/NADP octopine/nopaline dehydrogenase family protein [Spirochaetia bacterium]|nr:NAD/NADP octopine/nopaline dehydrogenase family protein [Spirochaetia bacterium]